MKRPWCIDKIHPRYFSVFLCRKKCPENTGLNRWFVERKEEYPSTVVVSISVFNRAHCRARMQLAFRK